MNLKRAGLVLESIGRTLAETPTNARAREPKHFQLELAQNMTWLALLHREIEHAFKSGEPQEFFDLISKYKLNNGPLLSTDDQDALAKMAHAHLEDYSERARDKLVDKAAALSIHDPRTFVDQCVAALRGSSLSPPQMVQWVLAAVEKQSAPGG